MCDDCSMVDEFICAKFQQEEGGNENRNIVCDSIDIDHGDLKCGLEEMIRSSIGKKDQFNVIW